MLSALVFLLISLASAGQFSQQQQLVPSDSTPLALAGSSVAMSTFGPLYACVGGTADNVQQGAFWLYSYLNTTWLQQGGKLVPSDTTSSSSVGYACALDSSATFILVSAPFDGGSTGTGAFWVYERNGTAIKQLATKVIPSDAASGDQVGMSLAMSSNAGYALVGGNGMWVYKRNVTCEHFTGTGYVQVGPRLVPQTSTVVGLGSAVAIDSQGVVAFLGGPQDNGRGAVFVYLRSGETWEFSSKVTPGSAIQLGASFGVSVSCDGPGSTLVVGASGDESGKGSVYVYTRSGAAWTQQGAKLVPSDALPPSMFGNSVRISSVGTNLVVGGYANSHFQGAAWLFMRLNSTTPWAQQGGRYVPSDSTFSAQVGSAVAVSGTGEQVMVGGYYNSNGKGAVWATRVIGSATSGAGSALLFGLDKVLAVGALVCGVLLW